MTTSTYTVTGMTCGHCASSVKEEVGELAGVTGIEVDVATGLVTVSSENALDPEAVRAAVKEAGYEVTA
ncbi:heavy-metal-associated domain-containing protein [Actinoalloteichus hymeniacidonis]|nr:heavy metal-associated domain-containing protein [Actinoalloteichus hymeniacidonis]